MKKNKGLLIISLILFSVLMASAVSAQDELTKGLTAIGKTFDTLITSYYEYSIFWDAVLIFALLLAILTAGKAGANKLGWGSDKDKTMNSVVIIISLIGALGTSVIFKNQGINLLSFVPFWLTSVVIVALTGGLIAIVWVWTEGEQMKRYRWGLIAFVLFVGVSCLRTILSTPVSGTTAMAPMYPVSWSGPGGETFSVVHGVPVFFSFLVNNPALNTGLLILQIVCAMGSIWGLFTFGKDMFFGVSQPITDEQLETLRKKGVSDAEYRKLKALKKAGEHASKDEGEIYRETRYAKQKLRQADKIIMEIMVKVNEGLRLISGGAVNPTQIKQNKSDICHLVNKLKELEVAVSGYMGLLAKLDVEFETTCAEAETGENRTKIKALSAMLLKHQEELNSWMELMLQTCKIEAERWKDTSFGDCTNVYDWWVKRVVIVDKFYKDLITEVMGIDAHVTHMRKQLLIKAQDEVKAVSEHLKGGGAPTPTSGSR